MKYHNFLTKLVKMPILFFTCEGPLHSVPLGGVSDSRVIWVTGFALWWWDIEDLTQTNRDLHLGRISMLLPLMAQNLHQTGCFYLIDLQRLYSNKAGFQFIKILTTFSVVLLLLQGNKTQNLMDMKILMGIITPHHSFIAFRLAQARIGLLRVPHRCPWDLFHYEVVKF